MNVYSTAYVLLANVIPISLTTTTTFSPLPVKMKEQRIEFSFPATTTETPDKTDETMTQNIGQ